MLRSGVHEGSRYYIIKLYAVGNKVLALARYRVHNHNKVGNEQWLFLPSLTVVSAEADFSTAV